MLVSTSLKPLTMPPASAAMQAAFRAIAISVHRRRRDARRDLARQFLTDRRWFDSIIPGLSDLEPGPRNDLLREFRRDPVRQMRHTPDFLGAALLAARAQCWLRLHRADALAVLRHPS